MTSVEVLKESYGYNVPIILKDIRIGGKSKQAIRKELSRAVKNGEIDRYGDGVYYFSTITPELNMKSVLSYDDVIVKKFIKNDYGIEGFDLNTFGFYSGYTFINQMHISKQVPAKKEITTNNTSCKRVYRLGNTETILRKPPIEITFQNYKALQFFEMFNWLSEEEYENNKELIINYFKKNLTIEDFEYSKYYRGKCLVRFYKDMIDYEVARK